jgi:hypothetical protein
MLFAGDDAEVFGDGACTTANDATRVNIANVTKDFMGFSFFRSSSSAQVLCLQGPTPIFYRLTPRKELAKATVPKDE